MEKYNINFWYRQAWCILTSGVLSLKNECSCHFLYHHPQLLPPFLVQFLYICGPLKTPNILDTWLVMVKRGKQMKMISPYPGCHEVWSAISEFFQSLDKGRIWWCNILGDNEGNISHILRLDTITAGYIWLNVKLVALKRKNYDPILTVKIPLMVNTMSIMEDKEKNKG